MLCKCGCGQETPKNSSGNSRNFVNKDHQWIKTKLCECGCGEKIPEMQMYGNNPYRYKGDHAIIGKRGARLGKGPVASLRGQTDLCACGCGTEIVISREGDGHLYKYATGHGMKGKIHPNKGTGKKNSTETKLCACGCGETIKKYDLCGRERKYKNNHDKRGKPGPTLGRKHTAEAREKLSVYHSQPENNTALKNSLGKRTEYKGVVFKSKTEAIRARQLDEMGLQWLYEEHSFVYYLPDGTKHRYTPDFYIPQLDYYEEVKGFYSEADKLKMKLVQEQHPHIKIVVISQKTNKELDKTYWREHYLESKHV